MRTDHYEFKILIKKPIRHQVQALSYFEFVHKNTPQITFLFRTDRGVLNNVSYLFIKKFFVLFVKLHKFFCEGT
jgi:hypothetical protein